MMPKESDVIEFSRGHNQYPSLAFNLAASTDFLLHLLKCGIFFSI